MQPRPPLSLPQLAPSHGPGVLLACCSVKRSIFWWEALSCHLHWELHWPTSVPMASGFWLKAKQKKKDLFWWEIKASVTWLPDFGAVHSMTATKHQMTCVEMLTCPHLHFWSHTKSTLILVVKRKKDFVCRCDLSKTLESQTQLSNCRNPLNHKHANKHVLHNSLRLEHIFHFNWRQAGMDLDSCVLNFLTQFSQSWDKHVPHQSCKNHGSQIQLQKSLNQMRTVLKSFWLFSFD